MGLEWLAQRRRGAEEEIWVKDVRLLATDFDWADKAKPYEISASLRELNLEWLAQRRRGAEEEI